MRGCVHDESSLARWTRKQRAPKGAETPSKQRALRGRPANTAPQWASWDGPECLALIWGTRERSCSS
eukprot:6816247-Pyramimonas_sp.AAC.1